MLIVTDLDGTLLRGDHAASSFTRGVFGQLQERGVRVGYSTSRSPEKAASLVRGLPLSAPSVALDGAVILDIGGEVLVEHPVPPEVVEEAVAFGVDRGLPPFLLGRERGRDVLAHGRSPTAMQRAFLAQRAGDPRLRSEARLRPLASTYVVSFVVGDPSPGLLDGLRGRRWSGVEVSVMTDAALPGATMIQLRSARATKGLALREVMRRLQVGRQSVIVFGDGENDLALFEEAGLAVAVENAHPDVARIAGARCASNDEDGVARWLADRFGLEP